ncbi:DUF3558 domain-containing protein [Amycolatopsis sp. 195334CR]|uniref:DUF3558 domain-containing protein n=1 Tax=Amycolatopsis sp. 195334CR TaxID=2814588 RepID=UPI001A8EC57C|nr:DUF3558 domain-containing protein [Amycolatopsis sp. 195334CR]MBN6035378.1 DUF3558 domain-containing protein [Amycolatopsis sp. 195334CR]
MIFRRFGLALLLVTVLPIAACGSPVSGRAIPAPLAAPGSAPPVLPAPPDSVVPKVKEPLDPAKFVADPCSSLTAARQAEFNVTSSRINEHDFGSSCIWNVGSGRTSLGVSYATKVPTGLGNIYALRDAGWWDGGYFEPTEVDGYPGVYVALVDYRASGDCKLVVGVNDSLFFESSVVTPPSNDSCLGAKNVAEAILQTIKEGA